MQKNSITIEIIIEAAAKLSNRTSLYSLSLKNIAEELSIKSPSLYNHVSSLDEIKEKLMIYGWKQVEDKMIDSVIGYAGYDALKNMCYSFYEYAIENKGVFSAMLWYNKFATVENKKVTTKSFDMMFKILRPLNFCDEKINHIIRTLRSFLEGFALLVNNKAFGNPISIDQSFEISLEIILNGIRTLGEKV